MRTIAISTLIFLATSIVSAAQAMPKPTEEHRTITQVLDRSVTNMQEELTSAADAMPDNKYGFVPKEGEFKGVRTEPSWGKNHQ